MFSKDNRDNARLLAPDPHACYHPRAFVIFRPLNEHQSAAPVKTPSVCELELWENLKAEGTTRLGIIGLADKAELVSLAVRLLLLSSH